MDTSRWPLVETKVTPYSVIAQLLCFVFPPEAVAAIIPYVKLANNEMSREEYLKSPQYAKYLWSLRDLPSPPTLHKLAFYEAVKDTPSYQTNLSGSIMRGEIKRLGMWPSRYSTIQMVSNILTGNNTFTINKVSEENISSSILRRIMAEKRYKRYYIRKEYIDVVRPVYTKIKIEVVLSSKDVIPNYIEPNYNYQFVRKNMRHFRKNTGKSKIPRKIMRYSMSATRRSPN